MNFIKCFPLYILLFNFLPSLLLSQPLDSTKQRLFEEAAAKIVAEGLGNGKAYEMLSELCRVAPLRLSGSGGEAKAVKSTQQMMIQCGFENVHLEPVTVPHWERGNVESAEAIDEKGKTVLPLRVLALGGSVATPPEGITADIIEAKSIEELPQLGERIKEKIVFFNRPVDKSRYNTFEAYGSAAGVRWAGAVNAARYGAVAVVIRSLTNVIDDHPHTGSMGYVDTIPKIPAAAITTLGAEKLSVLLKNGKSLKLKLKLKCQTLPDARTFNVVGELRGTEKPEEIIVIGGHLDAWDVGQGAHDDGAGCIQSIEALRLLKELGLKPKRTIRAVMFANEENGLRGGTAYAKVNRPGEKHIAAIESDMGGFMPRGFTVQGTPEQVQKVARFAPLFEVIEADRIRTGGGGSDISPLAAMGVPAIGLRCDAQRYFKYHHCETDVIEAVNDRELQLGACALAILAYALAMEGM